MSEEQSVDSPIKIQKEEQSEKIEKTDDNKYAIQMQIITFQDQTINNLKNIVLEKEQDLQSKSQELNQTKQQLNQLQNQLRFQQQQNENEINITQQQLIKTTEELKKLKNIFTQNSNPDLIMESLHLKEQIQQIKQQNTKLEMDLKESQTRLIQSQQMVTDLQRENYHYKSMQLPQSYQIINKSNQLEDNSKNIRKMQLKTELLQIPIQGRNQMQIRRVQQIEDELNYLESQY